MDWRDLLAWQQPREEVIDVTSADEPLQLCQQDPHRIYLRISLCTPLARTVFLTTNPNPDGTFGIPINAVGLETSPFANFTLIGFLIAASAGTMEFWLDRHGALAQRAWYTYVPFANSVWHIQTLTQDEAPCERQPRKESANGESISWNRPTFFVGQNCGCGHDEYPDSLSGGQALGAGDESNEPESLLAKFRRGSSGG